MNNIPTGKVTFLFTDIEGSTKLSQEFPETIQSALDKHHSIMHSAIVSNNGFVFKIVGDAFCCAFQNTDDAVKAAVTGQLNLANEKWDDAVIKIRIGIHSGNAEWNGKEYMGYITLARVSRVMSSAYGEQIIISNDAYELYNNHKDTKTQSNIESYIDSSCPGSPREAGDLVVNEITFHDLGERRLKDIIQPIRLYQIVSPDLRENFPPLKTLDSRPNNLPIQLTSFIGRENVLKELKELFQKTRLLTITGSGGAGKTRLAMQLGADMIDNFSNGVFITELAAVNHPSLLVQTVMNSLDLNEGPGRSLNETLTEYLHDKEMILIMDNCEHLVNECAGFAEMLLIKCPKLKIITTSRESLNCHGEQTYRLPSLAFPDITGNITAEQLTQYEAVRLFMERALAVNPGFRVNNENAQALAQICFQLDGIPLAIELAAVRVKVLTLNNICERLNNRFKLLTGGKRTALPRQQTLKALIDWSYDLLSEHEKILWNRLSVFRGGWTLESAEEICTDEKITIEEILDLLCSLTEKSIIIYDIDKQRYRILETLKQYGEEKLSESNESEVISSRHLHYFMEISETAEPKLKGSEMHVWLEKLEADHRNLRTAIEWSTGYGDKKEEGSPREAGARLAGSLGYFWKVRGHYSTGRRLLESILDNPQGVSKISLAKLLHRLGSIFTSLCEYEKAQKFLEESLVLSREMEEKPGIVFCLNNLGNVASYRGNYEQAQKFYEESLTLSREIAEKRGILTVLCSLGNVAYNQGNYEQAQKLHEESLAVSREIGEKRGIAFSLNSLGTVADIQGNDEEAQKLYEESLAISREIGEKRGIAFSLNNLGIVAYNLGNYEQAQKFFEESLTLSREMGEKSVIADSLNSLGDLTNNRGNYEQAQKYHEESLSLRREMGDKRLIAESLNSLGNFAHNQGDYEQALKYHEESLTLFRELNHKRGIALSLIGFAGMLSADNQSLAVTLLGAAEAALKSMGTVLVRTEQNLLEQIIKKLYEKLNDEEFEKYFEEGKKLPIEQAADLILNACPPRAG